LEPTTETSFLGAVSGTVSRFQNLIAEGVTDLSDLGGEPVVASMPSERRTSWDIRQGASTL